MSNTQNESGANAVKFTPPQGRDTGNRPAVDSPLHQSRGWNSEARSDAIAEHGDKYATFA